MTTTWPKGVCAVRSVYVPSVLEINLTSHTHNQAEQSKKSALATYLNSENQFVLWWATFSDYYLPEGYFEKQGLLFKHYGFCFVCFFTHQMYETRLTLQVTVRMEEKRQENLSEELDSSLLKENSQDTSQHAQPVRRKEQSQMSLQTVVALSAGSCWLILRRQLNPQVWRHNPSPLCSQRLSPLCYTRSSPRSSSPTLSPAAAEIWQNEPRWTWSSCRQSWETWGTSLTRWRVNTSTTLSLRRFWVFTRWLMFPFDLDQ